MLEIELMLQVVIALMDSLIHMMRVAQQNVIPNAIIVLKIQIIVQLAWCHSLILLTVLAQMDISLILLVNFAIEHASNVKHHQLNVLLVQVLGIDNYLEHRVIVPKDIMIMESIPLANHVVRIALHVVLVHLCVPNAMALVEMIKIIAYAVMGMFRLILTITMT